MMTKAKEEFFSYGFKEKMDMGGEHERGIRMMLWTIIDGDIYLESSTHAPNSARYRKAKT